MGVQKQNKNKSYWTWITAFLGGAIAAIFLSPWTGKRTRNWVSQRYSHYSALSNRTIDKAGAKVRYGAGFLQGWLYKTRSFLNPSEREDLDDDLLAQRVQTALGENPLTWDLPRINVNSEDFIVTIRGPVNSIQQLHDAENVVNRVKGVRRVINDMRMVA